MLYARRVRASNWLLIDCEESAGKCQDSLHHLLNDPLGEVDLIDDPQMAVIVDALRSLLDTMWEGA